MTKKQKQLILALGLGAFALFLNKMYLDSRISDLKEKKEISVLLAKRRIRAGTLLETSMLEKQSVPETYAPKGRIKASQISQILGQEISSDVAAGDYILQSNFRTIGSVGPTLSAQLDGDNARAITLPVDETNSFARSIVTGDKIDIIFTFSTPRARQKLSIVLFQNVPVIATGSYSMAEQERGGRRSARYNTLTLRLTAEEALRLNYALQMGKINVLLRNPKDNALVDLPPIGNVMDLLSPADKKLVGDAERNQMKNAKLKEQQYKEQVKMLMDMQRKQKVGGR